MGEIRSRNLEAPIGFEPMHNNFADQADYLAWIGEGLQDTVDSGR
jgi:hypothetical protein